MDRKLKATERILGIMNDLREKCPWDREQTFLSLRNNTIEETYELTDAITDGNMDNIKEELGDLLLQVVMQAEIANELGLFDFEDVAQVVKEKMIRRHPHVFGDVKADTWPLQGLYFHAETQQLPFPPHHRHHSRQKNYRVPNQNERDA